MVCIEQTLLPDDCDFQELNISTFKALTSGFVKKNEKDD